MPAPDPRPYVPPEPVEEYPPLLDRFTAETLFRLVGFDEGMFRLRRALNRMDEEWKTATTTTS